MERAKPAKATWIIWSILDLTILVGMYIADSLNGSIVGASAGATSVAVLSLKFGSSGWKKVDLICLAGAIVGIALMVLRDEPFFGIISCVVVFMIGSIPTFISAWQDPSRENKFAWTIFWISCLLALASIKVWNFESTAQPITFTVIESTMMFLLFIRPLFKKDPSLEEN